jgi:streptogramin lyase
MNTQMQRMFAVSAVVLACELPTYSQGNPGGTATNGVPQTRAEITINDTRTMPENLTSSQDGTVFFGSTAKGTIYRAAPGATQADAWIQAGSNGLNNVLGVLADDKSSTLWVVSNVSGGRGAPSTGQMALRSFDLKTGAARGTYAAEGGGTLNDIAIAPDGSVYVSETFGGRMLRLKQGATALDVWVTNPQLRGVDGLSFLADGALYVNNFFSGSLSRIPVKADGTAGEIMPIETSLKFSRPDGLRTSISNTLLQVEGQGRLTEITIEGNRGQVRVIREGLTRATGVTQIGAIAYVLVEQLKAVAVPMAESPAHSPSGAAQLQ